jgi:hypothetical protein
VGGVDKGGKIKQALVQRIAHRMHGGFFSLNARMSSSQIYRNEMLGQLICLSKHGAQER